MGRRSLTEWQTSKGGRSGEAVETTDWTETNVVPTHAGATELIQALRKVQYGTGLTTGKG